MKIQTLVSVLLAVSFTLAGPVWAQGPGARNDRDRDEHMQRGGPQMRHMPPGQMRKQERREDRREERREERRDGWRGERGAGPGHSFYRGGYLPRYYRGYTYVVDDWRGHRLSAPPRGHQWVQTGSDYVLIAIATGIIVQILLGN